MISYGGINFYPVINSNNEYQVGEGSKENIGSGLQDDQIETINIPSYISINNQKKIVTILANYCFKNKINLRSVSIPNTIKVIGIDSFWNTAVTTLIIPSSVERLEDYSFSRVNSIKTIVFEKEIHLKTTGNHIFAGFPIGAIIYFCSSDDMSKLTNPFWDSTNSNPTIYVLENYPNGATFGGKGVKRKNTEYCQMNFSKTTIVYIKKNEIESSLTFIFIMNTILI